MTHEEGFYARKPWVTKFRIDGKEYGGEYDAMEDVRLAQFAAAFPDARKVIELGSLEGGHTFGLLKNTRVTNVLAVEGRQINIDRAVFVQGLLGETRAKFVLDDLERTDLTKYGRFDACFCSGVSYHLKMPWQLLRNIRFMTNKLFIWTHVWDQEPEMRTADGGYEGGSYIEGGLNDPLSGLSARSFWPTLSSLLRMCKDTGWRRVEIINEDLHKNGYAVTLQCEG